ncbi:MAG TPA: neuromedin U [Polyangia bacterium]|jgi:hypothetical protein|nr:neuromedin U [Polyangia bacterium]
MTPSKWQALAPICAALMLPTLAFAMDEHAPPEREESPGKATPEEKQDEAKKLAEQSQNPISSLISFPFQFNFAGGMGPFHRSELILNMQPVIPIPLTKTWTLVPRLITPFVGIPDVTQDRGTTWGLGDFNPQIYVALQLPGGFTVGLGPTIVIPTATDPTLGSGKLSIGPSLVGVWIGHGLVTGVLVNNAWSVGGDPARKRVDAFFLQPFINVNLPRHTYLVTAPEITGDWVDSHWVVPVGGGAGAIVKLGSPVNINLQGYWNAFAPTGTPTWLVRFQVTYLFPIAKKASAAESSLDEDHEERQQ